MRQAIDAAFDVYRIPAISCNHPLACFDCNGEGVDVGVSGVGASSEVLKKQSTTIKSLGNRDSSVLCLWRFLVSPNWIQKLPWKLDPSCMPSLLRSASLKSFSASSCGNWTNAPEINREMVVSRTQKMECSWDINNINMYIWEGYRGIFIKYRLII